MSAARHFVLVVYDISDDRRRTRLHNALLDFGTPVQYSVFECLLDDRQLTQMKRAVRRRIRPRLDRVRFYYLCRACRARTEVTSGAPVTAEPPALIVGGSVLPRVGGVGVRVGRCPSARDEALIVCAVPEAARHSHQRSNTQGIQVAYFSWRDSGLGEWALARPAVVTSAFAPPLRGSEVVIDGPDQRRALEPIL